MLFSPPLSSFTLTSRSGSWAVETTPKCFMYIALKESWSRQRHAAIPDLWAVHPWQFSYMDGYQIYCNQLSTSHVVESHHQLMLSLAKLQITTIYMSQAFLSLKHGDFGVGPLAHHTNQYLNTIYIYMYCVVICCHGVSWWGRSPKAQMDSSWPQHLREQRASGLGPRWFQCGINGWNLKPPIGPIG